MLGTQCYCMCYLLLHCSSHPLIRQPLTKDNLSPKTTPHQRQPLASYKTTSHQRQPLTSYKTTSHQRQPLASYKTTSHQRQPLASYKTTSHQRQPLACSSPSLIRPPLTKYNLWLVVVPLL